MSRDKLIGWALVLIVAALICSFLAPIGWHMANHMANQASKDIVFVHFDHDGCSASYRAVEAKLKSPSSARRIGCHSTYGTGGVNIVTLELDSQNGYGAMIRSQWMTTVRDNNVESVIQIQGPR